MKSLSLASLAIFCTCATAHSIFQELYVNGVSAGHYTGIRVPNYNGPITDVTSNDIICNGGINPYRTPLPQDVITVPSGATVTAEWHHGDGPDPSDSSDPIDPSHKGPILAYLAKVPSALQTDVTGLKWFKIYHDGLDASTNTWAVDKLITNKGKVSFKIPDCIEAGEYLLRVELIALHGAGSYPGAQFYMECAQVKITGGGNTSPGTVSFPGAYSGSHPGVLVNIYYPPLTSYTIPGPAVFTCAAGSGTSTTAISSATTPPTSSTTSISTTTLPTPSTSSPAGTVPQWGQCGGNGYTGPTACVTPYTCKVTNEWYSQCL